MKQCLSSFVIISCLFVLACLYIHYFGYGKTYSSNIGVITGDFKRVCGGNKGHRLCRESDIPARFGGRGLLDTWWGQKNKQV